MPRWTVELTDDVHDVGAATMTIHESGALTFKQTLSGPIFLAYAQGHWLAVTRDEEDD